MRTTFQEIMIGQARLAGEERPRPVVLDLSADVPGLLAPWSDVEAVVTGRVRVDGWADDPMAAGTLRIAPLSTHRIRYQLDFTTSDGRGMHLDGWKSLSLARPLRSMTRLPATITDDKGDVIGETQLRFDLRRSLGPMLTSFRLRAADHARGPASAGDRGHRTSGARAGKAPRGHGPAQPASYLSARWRGQPGRLEVWYTTLTDPATGTGFWLHHELVAPSDGSEPYAHGWAAIFPPDVPRDGPVLARFGPVAWSPPEGETVFAADGVRMTQATLRGSAAEIGWDLTADGGGPPLFTFPRWAWNSEALPGAQIVPVPSATFRGHLRQRRRLRGGGGHVDPARPEPASAVPAGPAARGRRGLAAGRPARPFGPFRRPDRPAHLDRARRGRRQENPDSGHPARRTHPDGPLYRPGPIHRGLQEQ